VFFRRKIRNGTNENQANHPQSNFGKDSVYRTAVRRQRMMSVKGLSV